MTIFRHLRLLPLLVIVSILSFLVRADSLIRGLSGVSAAYAEAPKTEEKKPEEKKETDHEKPDTKATEKPAAEKKGNTDKSKEWRDSSEAEFSQSDVQEKLYNDLASRSKMLDKRESDLDARDALLKVGERELDQKFRELTGLRQQIEGLLKTQSDEEAARIKSLVMIYEGMKPKEAAQIFDTLDMDVLIRVMSGMSERKSGPILAAMSPERARAVTILLAQQQRLPPAQRQ